MIRPPRPIRPRNLQGGVETLFLVDESDGGTMPAAASFSGTRGLVNNKIGSRGSCIIQTHVKIHN